jgi:hypothetical protein
VVLGLTGSVARTFTVGLTKVIARIFFIGFNVVLARIRAFGLMRGITHIFLFVSTPNFIQSLFSPMVRRDDSGMPENDLGIRAVRTLPVHGPRHMPKVAQK